MQEVVPFMVAFSSLPSLNPTTISCLLGHQGKKSTHTECHKDLGEGSMEYPPLRGNDWGSPQFFGERNQVGNIVYHIFRQLWLVLGVKLMEINSNGKQGFQPRVSTKVGDKEKMLLTATSSTTEYITMCRSYI